MILFFTGIRYERDLDVERAPVPPALLGRPVEAGQDLQGRC